MNVMIKIVEPNCLNRMKQISTIKKIENKINTFANKNMYPAIHVMQGT